MTQVKNISPPFNTYIHSINFCRITIDKDKSITEQKKNYQSHKLVSYLFSKYRWGRTLILTDHFYALGEKNLPRSGHNLELSFA